MNKKYIICRNPSISNTLEVLEELTKLLETNSLEYRICDIDKPCNDGDFVFVIGGDGTILKAARFYSANQTPIFGINLGRLGFLSQTSKEGLEHAFKQVISGDYKIENRLMLKTGDYVALNDFVVKGNESSRATRFAVEIDGNFLGEYSADGIIISTPTGSTAYSMAAGGPIITPELEVISIAPICPHTLSARPILVSSEAEVKILPAPNHCYNISGDGQFLYSDKSEIVIKKSENKANLALLKQNEFYSVLRDKLKWSASLV